VHVPDPDVIEFSPGKPAGQAILGAANYITAAICQLTGDQPARACTPAIRALLGN
jgi:hypothetical protein